MKKVYLLSVVIALFINVNAQILWNNPINGTNPNTSNPYTTGQTVNPNITVSGIGRGSGISSASANDRYSASGWNTSIPATLDINDYFYFTLTPNAGYQIDFANFQFTLQNSGTGPTTFALRSSLDNYATNITTAITSSASPGTSNTVLLSAAQFQGITSSITFRLYGYGASAGGGTLSVNDFTFNGATALPVAFDKVQATKSNGQLKVLWITSSETNNDHFDVEVSKNGKDFTKITSIKSKAGLGNSSVPIKYEYTTPLNNLLVSVIPLLLLLFSIGYKKRFKQTYLLLGFAIILFAISCNKKDLTTSIVNSKLFVRIAQVDIDGTKTFSKTVQVIQE